MSHSVGCLYRYALARLQLQDTDQMRVLFYDAHNALHWPEDADKYQVPSVEQTDECAECDRARSDRDE